MKDETYTANQDSHFRHDIHFVVFTGNGDVMILTIALWTIGILIAIIAITEIIAVIQAPKYSGTYNWKIKAGHHYCSFWQRTLFFIYWFARLKFFAYKMEYTVIFNKSMVYEFTDGNQDDWNKLPGFQKGFDKTTRYLRGWRWNARIRVFEWCYYWHNRDVKPSYSDGIVVSGNEKRFVINSPFKFATPLFPYFGGTNPAPHDMIVPIKNMVVK